jgi:hypothetical protein
MASSKHVLSLLQSLRITEVYPKIEMYQIRKYYRNTDVAFDGMPNSEITTRQGTIFGIHGRGRRRKREVKKIGDL